ncbi:osmotically inducible protein OsmC [Lentilactobacillus curieae]|uniref:Osmotically inducible protein OsmC n=1 Tax=Lentilactobacillus curieae TaxID=1138822 RepID=A0A1S6QIA6_9LACO|nr:OsmC family protein [Lentilactobacillus curieae]AQW21338.1 osmotically inducible protein OsmC [Lentilactobacillus curieae]
MASYSVHTAYQNVGAKTITTAGNHEFTADRPTKVHGTDAGPTPIEYLLGSIGACFGATASILARRMDNLEIEKFDVDVSGETTVFPDKSSKISKINIIVDCKTNLSSDEQQNFVEEVIHRCTVHKTLEDAVEMAIEIKR